MNNKLGSEMKMRPELGVTLIELLIVVSIVAILTAIAVPSYQAYAARARRADAETVLLQTAQFVERYYTEQSPNTYVGATPIATESPIEGSAKYYDILLAPTATTYLASAVPKNAMAGDSCGTLTLSNTGVKGSAAAVSTCWRQ